MYIESKSAKVFIVILGIIAISLIGFMLNEQWDNLNSSEDRKELRQILEKNGDVSNDTKYLIGWLANLVKISNTSQKQYQSDFKFHINKTVENAIELDAIHNDTMTIKKALKIP